MYLWRSFYRLKPSFYSVLFFRYTRREVTGINYILILVTLAVIALLLGVLSGYFLRRYLAEAKIASAEEAANKIIEESKKEVAGKKREAILEAKEEVHQLRSEAERETRERRNEVQRLERRIQQKEESIDRKMESLEKKEDSLIKKEQDLAQIRAEVDALDPKANLRTGADLRPV